MEKPAREIHGGVKFGTEFLSAAVPADSRLEELKTWCAEFHKRNFAPPYGEFSQGNLSFRIRPGETAFIISGSQVGWKNRLTDDRFVTVQGCDLEKGNVIRKRHAGPLVGEHAPLCHLPCKKRCSGRLSRYSPEILRCVDRPPDIPETRNKHSYGSLELVQSVIEVLGDTDFVIMTRHGFISLGNTMEEAGRRAIAVHHRCLAGKEKGVP